MGVNRLKIEYSCEDCGTSKELKYSLDEMNQNPLLIYEFEERLREEGWEIERDWQNEDGDVDVFCPRHGGLLEGDVMEKNEVKELGALLKRKIKSGEFRMFGG